MFYCLLPTVFPHHSYSSFFSRFASCPKRKPMFNLSFLRCFFIIKSLSCLLSHHHDFFLLMKQQQNYTTSNKDRESKKEERVKKNYEHSSYWLWWLDYHVVWSSHHEWMNSTRSHKGKKGDTAIFKLNNYICILDRDFKKWMGYLFTSFKFNLLVCKIWWAFKGLIFFGRCGGGGVCGIYERCHREKRFFFQQAISPFYIAIHNKKSYLSSLCLYAFQK